MLFGFSVVRFLIGLFVAVCVFFLAQYFIPMLFGLVGWHMPANIVNIFSLLIAVGAVYGTVTYRGAVAP